MSTMLKMHIPRIKYAKPNLYDCNLNFCLSIKGSAWKIFLKHTASHIYKPRSKPWLIPFNFFQAVRPGKRPRTLTHGHNMINSDKAASGFFSPSLFCSDHYICVSPASIAKSWHSDLYLEKLPYIVTRSVEIQIKMI